VGSLDVPEACRRADRFEEVRRVLVLTRKVDESIMIGDDVEVRVLSCDGAKVRLGIQAPSNIPVHRTEIYLEIKAHESRSIIGEEPDQPARPKRAS
jgi:carbon storage regulator